MLSVPIKNTILKGPVDKLYNDVTMKTFHQGLLITSLT